MVVGYTGPEDEMHIMSGFDGGPQSDDDLFHGMFGLHPSDMPSRSDEDSDPADTTDSVLAQDTGLGDLLSLIPDWVFEGGILMMLAFLALVLVLGAAMGLGATVIVDRLYDVSKGVIG